MNEFSDEIVPDLEHIEEYGDPLIRSGNAKVPKWLIFVFITLPIWGIVWFFLYWNGVTGFLNPGGWFALEEAANTTFPSKNAMQKK